nr:hypothetical protein [Tanacetum cinerariifolium]
MRRVRKGFSGVETPLFERMLAVGQPAEEELVDEQVQIDNAVAVAVDENVKENVAENVSQAAIHHLHLMTFHLLHKHYLHLLNNNTEDDSEVQEVVEVVTTAKLITKVVTAAASQVSAASTTIHAASVTIPAAMPTIPVAAPTVVASYTIRWKGVIIRDPEEKLPLKNPAETPVVKDKSKRILVETPKPMKKKDQIKMDAEYARKLQEEIDRDHDGFSKYIDWDAAMDHVNQKSTRFDENIRFLFKSREEMEAEDQEIIKSINETPTQKAAKRRKLSEEAQEAKDLRKQLEVVEDEDDNVIVKATLIASKVPVVDYQIVLINKKPSFKIIRADETHQLYISFATLLKNFNREDLETSWRIVKDGFSTSIPTNFLDEYLLLTLKTMFEEPDGQDAIWRNQKSVHGLSLVKRWKLLASCGVHVITLSTVQLFLLVERRKWLNDSKCVRSPLAYKKVIIAMQSMVEMSLQREQVANISTHTSEPSRCFNSICYDDDDDDNDDEERTIHLCDIISQFPPSIVITTFPPILPNFEDPEDSLIMRNEEISTIPVKESDEVIKSGVKDLVPILSESKDTSRSDSEFDLSSCENNSMSGNPTPSSNSEVGSISPSPIPYKDSDPLLEETDILLSHFDNSSPEYETFSYDIEEKSSGSTITHSNYSLLDYEAFYVDDDHIEEKSSDSTTTHSYFSLPEYDFFIFDLSINPFPPVDRSVSHHEEFADELTHIISSPEYDCFHFDTETDSGDLTILFEENVSKDTTKEFTSPELNYFPLILSDCDSTFFEKIYEIDLLVSFPFGNKDKVFDPGIFIIKRVQSKRFHIFPLDNFPTFSFVSDSLLLIDPSEIETFLSFPFENEDKVFDPWIFFINEVFSFTRRTPHILSDNFLINKCHIFREISLMTESSVIFHPKNKEIREQSS